MKILTKFQNSLKYAGVWATVFAVSPLSAFADAVSDNINLDADPKYNLIKDLKPSGYVKTGINVLLGVAGVISFFFLLWGGIQWILAGGDKEGTEKARKRITNALIGLAIVFSAYALLFLLNALFGVDIIGGFTLKQIGT